MDDNIIEKLSDYEHDRWSRWQKHVFDKCIKSKDGNLYIPNEYVDRWKREMNTNYYDLSEEEKESDRKEARIILKIINDDKSNNQEK